MSSSPNSKGDKKKNPLDAMGAFFSAQVDRRKLLTTQKQALATRCSSSGDCEFPGSGHRPADRKTWMAELGPEKLRVYQVVWPGSHDSATNKIGIPFITRPFAQCQSLSRLRPARHGVPPHRRPHPGGAPRLPRRAGVLLRGRGPGRREAVPGGDGVGAGGPGGAHGVRARGPAGVRQVPGGAARGGEPDPAGRRRILEDRGGAAPEEGDLRVEAEEVAGAGPRRAAVERGAPEGQLDRHGPAGDQVREQSQVPRAAAEGGRPAVPVPGGEHGDAAGRQPCAVREARHAPHPRIREALPRRGLRQGPRRQAAGLLHRLHRRRLRRRLRRRHQGPRRRRRVRPP